MRSPFAWLRVSHERPHWAASESLNADETYSIYSPFQLIEERYISERWRAGWEHPQIITLLFEMVVEHALLMSARYYLQYQAFAPTHCISNPARLAGILESSLSGSSLWPIKPALSCPNCDRHMDAGIKPQVHRKKGRWIDQSVLEKFAGGMRVWIHEHKQT